MTEPDHVVSKSEFARLCNVSPSRVSQWIAEGKIRPEHMAGTGRNARIKVGPARRHIAGCLDDVMARNDATGGTTLNRPMPLAHIHSDPQPDPAEYRARADLSDDFIRGALYGMHATAYSVPTLIAESMMEGGCPKDAAVAVYQEQRTTYADCLIGDGLRALGLIGEDDDTGPERTKYAPKLFLGLNPSLCP